MPNILAATLGTWQLVPEIIGFTNPGVVDLYRNHPEAGAISSERLKTDIQPVDQIWLVTTCGSFAMESLESLLRWYEFLDRHIAPELYVWKVAGTRNLSTAGECRLMSEAIFRMVWSAANTLEGGRLVLSLAGGRKTMSSDLQRAASAFGCHSLLHVTQNEAIKDFRKWQTDPEMFIAPIPEEFLDAVTPIVVGGYARNPALDIEENLVQIQGSHTFILPQAIAGGIELEIKPVETEPFLVDVVEKIIEKSAFLYCHYTGRMVEGEKLANFMALYSLPTNIIKKLKETRIGINPDIRGRELAFLKKLPKTDLHCHLGGIAGAEEIIEIAEANKVQISRYRDRLGNFLDHWKKRITREDPDILHREIVFKDLREAVEGVPEPLCTAAFVLLFQDRPERLDRIIYGPCVQEKEFCGIGFDAYEKLGDVQGSGLLQSRESLEAACRIICRKAQEHQVRYLELRCSPVNYLRGGLSPGEVVTILEKELSRYSTFRHGIIFIASRHGQMSKVYEQIELAGKLMGPAGDGFPSLAGFDLAGEEKAASPVNMRTAFLPMMEKCLHLTIHAGETADVKSIWEAVYHLNAERIGHGLTLKGNPALLERFRDRGIALEMCPSSNTQIVGFRDNFFPRKNREREIYPLKEYLDAGLRVTVNTDNAGISRTDFTTELHRAARLTPGGLSWWEILLILRNGFKAAFVRKSLRQGLLREAEKEIITLLEKNHGELPGLYI